MARVRMLPGRHSTGGRSLKASSAAARRLCSAPEGPHAIVSLVPGMLRGGAAPLAAGCTQTTS
eukprot:250254-Chlamydomonas_euryale.AAC.2